MPPPARRSNSLSGKKSLGHGMYTNSLRLKRAWQKSIRPLASAANERDRLLRFRGRLPAQRQLEGAIHLRRRIVAGLAAQAIGEHSRFHQHEMRCSSECSACGAMVLRLRRAQEPTNRADRTHRASEADGALREHVDAPAPCRRDPCPACPARCAWNWTGTEPGSMNGSTAGPRLSGQDSRRPRASNRGWSRLPAAAAACATGSGSRDRLRRSPRCRRSII